MKPAVGIDLGTTNSALAVMDGGEPVVVPDAGGELLTPSVVAFTADGGHLVGRPAKLQAAANVGGTIASIKRRMGQQEGLRVGSRTWRPEEISALILGKLKADAEAYLGAHVDRAVITVPAYFDDHQRRATMNAAALAGLEVSRIINEPTAAALAYGAAGMRNEYLMVWDLGGGTFDVSLLQVHLGVLRVRAVSGDSHLGGDDFDVRLADHLAREAWGLDGAAISPAARHRLRVAAERAKIALSDSLETVVRLPSGDEPPGGDDAGAKLVIRRADFDALTDDLVRRLQGPALQVLEDAAIPAVDVDRLLLVGGATRMPAVRNLARRIFGREPCSCAGADTVVARGAALQAAMLQGGREDIVLADVCPLSLGIETRGGMFTPVIERNTPVPVSRGRIFATAEDNQADAEIHVLQGERAAAADNISLGRLHLEGISPLPRGQGRLEVVFTIDVNGRVRVSATDLHSDHTRDMTFDAPAELTGDRVARMLREASAHSEDDRRFREHATAATRAGSVIALAEEQLATTGGSAETDLVERVNVAVLRVRSAVSSRDVEAIRRRTDELLEILKPAARRAGIGARSR